MTDVDFHPDEDLSVLLGATDNIRRALLVLAAPESLTDELALWLLDSSAIVEPETILDLLHGTDLVVERNSEWNLRASAREFLLKELVATPEVFSLAHRLLLGIAEGATDVGPGSNIPLYLSRRSGHAYHLAAVRSGLGLEKYAELALEHRSGDQWLGSRLAREQQALGILPANAIELEFLQGMVLFREGRYRRAEPILRRIAEAPGARIEIAIAAHIVGRRDGRAGRHRDGIRLLEKSILILEALGDDYGLALVFHSLGELLGRTAGQHLRAEALLRRSLEIGEQTGDEMFNAPVLHTLGRLLGRESERVAESESHLRRSLEILEQGGDEIGVAQVLHTLGQLLGRDSERVAEAELLLRRSLEIEEQAGNEMGVAQVLHTLGQLLGRDGQRLAEAEALLRRSVGIGQEYGKLNHQAQVLRTLALTLERVGRRDEALELLGQSLAINRQSGNRSGRRIVESDLRRLHKGPGGT